MRALGSREACLVDFSSPRISIFKDEYPRQASRSHFAQTLRLSAGEREPPFTTRLPLRCVDSLQSVIDRVEAAIDGPSDIPSHLEGRFLRRHPQVKAASPEPPVTVQARLLRPGMPSIETPRRHFCHRDPGTRNSADVSSTAPAYCLVAPRNGPATLREVRPMDVTPSNATPEAAFSISAPMQPADRSASSGPVHRVHWILSGERGGLDFEHLRSLERSGRPELP